MGLDFSHPMAVYVLAKAKVMEAVASARRILLCHKD